MTQETPQGSPRGTALMISYDELVRIRTYMAEISAQLTAALALKGDFDRLEHRVEQLELNKAYSDGGSSTKKTILVYLAGVVSSAMGGGALMYLPKLGAVLLHLPATH